tara:strand:+ start:735 stop:1019 length:285 start_codon:yes stop_codon:yes gene_type:complete
MKIKRLLEIQKAIQGKVFPVDIENELTKFKESNRNSDTFLYWSRTKGEWISIFDMDIIHVIRALNHESQLELQEYKEKMTNQLIEYIKDYNFDS